MAGDRSLQDKIGMHEDWKDGHDQNRLHVNSILEDYLEYILNDGDFTASLLIDRFGEAYQNNPLQVNPIYNF